jgi:hypothetical protein
MDHLIDLIKHLLQNSKEYITGVSFIVTGLGAVAAMSANGVSVLFKRRYIKQRRGLRERDTIEEASPRITVAGGNIRVRYKEDETPLTRWETRDSVSPSLVARGRVFVRIAEASAARQEQLSVQKWSKAAANLLTIGQFIIGGVLASSFVQQSLAPRWVGALGVLVLIASLFKQQYHPEINAENARAKASNIQALIRSSEDQLAILDVRIAAGQDHSDAMITLLTQITQRLTEIENPEAIESKLKIRA